MLRNLCCALVVAFALYCAAGGVVYAASTSTVVSGSVADETGAPIAGATVTLKGPGAYATATDAKGVFSIAAVTPGVYNVIVTKAGYSSAVEPGIAVLADQPEVLTVRMERATFSSLRTIASVRSNSGRGSINTAAASVSVVGSQAFVDQGQTQVTRVLSQVPGVQISFPSNSANAAAPGSITVPNIRGATSYETASLIDGHPISVGQYGDNVTTFLNSNMFGSVEIVKGPGADSPVVNNAIGGTTNFRTKDPTLTPQAELSFGFDSHGGTLSNFSYSDTVGKLGFIADFATLNDTSALNNKSVYFDPSFGSYNGNTLSGNATYSNVGNTSSNIQTGYSLLACCWQLAGYLDQAAELLKFRYKFSPSTTATVSYLGGQSYSDQNGNTSAFTNATFAPGDPTYNGSLQPGPIQVANIFPGSFAGEINNEPIFQAEVNTTMGKDTLLARYYHASISRFQFQGSNPNDPDYNTLKLFGVSGGDPPINGTTASVGFSNYYQEPEIDRLSGGTFEYQHPFGTNDLLTFSADRTIAQTTDYAVFGGPFYSHNLPPGTTQTQTTYLLRGHFYIGEKLEATLSNYLNTYSSTYPIGCPAGGCDTYDAAVKGTGVIFQTSTNAHYDPRLGLVYRPNGQSSIRLALGSSIAPPFLGLLNQIASSPAYDSTNQVAIEQQSNGNLRPETGFGFDLGGDVRLKDQTTVISGDLYRTNLFNRFFGQTVATGLTCAQVTCTTTGPPIPPSTPVVNQTNVNISNARFEGVELSIKHEPAVGFGFDLSGALQRGYYYNLPQYFYCSLPGPGCTMDQNLNVIAGQNTNGVGVGIGGQSYNGNMRIPYSQANAEFSYRFANGAYASFGDTYYGNNNSLNRPAFGIAYASVRYPVSKTLSLQLSGDNLFGAYPGILPVTGDGRAISLANGLTAATTGNVLGPATFRLVLSAKLP
ncbi:MAG: TonB-dependent receptor [Candidatus Eremiobacteraeota bacterium]|nr:TonB-dependent receptor [Candidatus Eremiobacteraeota bacterium]